MKFLTHRALWTEKDFLQFLPNNRPSLAVIQAKTAHEESGMILDESSMGSFPQSFETGGSCFGYLS